MLRSVVLGLCILFSAQPLSADDGIVQSIVEGWRKNQDNIKSVFYRAKGRAHIPKGSYSDDGMLVLGGGPVPATDLAFDKDASWSIDFQNKRVRKEITSEIPLLENDQLRLVPSYTVNLFDGVKMRQYTPREKNSGAAYSPSEFQPDLELKSESFGAFFFLATDFPVLLAHGMIVTNDQWPHPGKMRRLLKAEDFRFRAIGLLEGRECYILRSTKPAPAGIDEYWVDRRQNNAVSRWARFVPDGRLWAQVDIQYKKDISGVVPTGWTITHYARDKIKDIVTASETLSVVDARFNPKFDVAQFTVDPAPGQNVSDLTTNKLYRVEADGSLTRLDPTGASPSTPQTKHWILACVVAVFLVLVGTRRRILSLFRSKGGT